MNAELTNQTVIVVGGTSGMGLAIARLAISRGASVTVASRSPDKVVAVASELGAVGVPLDTTDEASVREFFAAVGPLDHLVVTGSSVRTGTLKDAPLEDGEFTFRSKFFGPYLCAKYAQMKPTGSITFFSGILSRRPGHNDAVLAGVNAAVEAMGRALARDLAPVRVNTVSPGMTRGTSAYLSMPEAAREGMYTSIASNLPVGRVGTADDIAAATLMLMTNGFITGVTLDVDGGGVLV
ncbi:short-chain dehydrogenase/reductase [Sulfuriferula nivalis]|uniref:Short-chain dehydrogenase/reductase n=2 Tax=Sulfuriferula nivalis TaxID=2675298 RepID=A0A809RLC6_9PROT|nr:short-chain dehydrogenase/reductase [Sulfuriferula nivalis]